MMRSKILGLIFLSMIFTFLLACTETESVLSEDERIDIYAAVIRQVYTVDNTFGDKKFPVIYLLRYTDDKVGAPGKYESNSILLSESMQEAILVAVDDLPADFRWINDRKEVIDEDSRVEGGDGAIITVGNIYVQEDDKVQVAGSIYFGDLGAGGRTYVVEKLDDVWRITGDTGVIWIS